MPKPHFKSKKRSVFLSHHVDIFDESNCDSTEATLLDQDESDPSPSPTVKSAFNLLGTMRTFTRVHFTFPKDSKKLIIEEHKDVKVIPSTQHSTTVNHQPIPQTKPVHSPGICPSPEKPSQDVDKSHLSDSASTNLSNLFALPQFMAQHNCEDLKPTDTVSTIPTCIQAYCRKKGCQRDSFHPSLNKC